VLMSLFMPIFNFVLMHEPSLCALKCYFRIQPLITNNGIDCSYIIFICVIGTSYWLRYEQK